MHQSKVKKHTLKNAKLCRKNLDKLPEMSLQEKVEAAASEAEGDPEAAASKLKESMTAKEKQSVWSKHQTWLKGNPIRRQKLCKKPEKGKRVRLQPCGWWSSRGLSTSPVTQKEALKKAENWESEKQILKKWSWEEMQLHLASGRLIWKQDPYSPGLGEGNTSLQASSWPLKTKKEKKRKMKKEKEKKKMKRKRQRLWKKSGSAETRPCVL